MPLRTHLCSFDLADDHLRPFHCSDRKSDRGTLCEPPFGRPPGWRSRNVQFWVGKAHGACDTVNSIHTLARTDAGNSDVPGSRKFGAASAWASRSAAVAGRRPADVCQPGSLDTTAYWWGWWVSGSRAECLRRVTTLIWRLWWGFMGSPSSLGAGTGWGVCGTTRCGTAWWPLVIGR